MSEHRLTIDVFDHNEIDGYHEVKGRGEPGPNGSMPIWSGRGKTYTEAWEHMIGRAMNAYVEQRRTTSPTSKQQSTNEPM